MTWPPRADNNHRHENHTCGWCNTQVRREDCTLSGGELVCETCLAEIYGDDGWDRIDT